MHKQNKILYQTLKKKSLQNLRTNNINTEISFPINSDVDSVVNQNQYNNNEDQGCSNANSYDCFCRSKDRNRIGSKSESYIRRKFLVFCHHYHIRSVVSPADIAAHKFLINLKLVLSWFENACPLLSFSYIRHVKIAPRSIL